MVVAAAGRESEGSNLPIGLKVFWAQRVAMSEKMQLVEMGLLDEDEECTEFPEEDWAGLDEDEDACVWEDNWDDDSVGD
ncbi:26S proteasome complex subunit SEM1 [Camelus dromedarius]|uniref:26S proteasome complex subunit SEM1 n=1 Tax=Camelus dromedarius TaxID=9838 RepID=A0A5N4DIT6_CAMDR|nr:26S proteasome complex subunit SEM1 [Camelus dromedarius]